jgi:hypothetical protein
MVRKLIAEYRQYRNFRDFVENSTWEEILLSSEGALDIFCICLVDFSFFYFGTSFLIARLNI